MTNPKCNGYMVVDARQTAYAGADRDPWGPLVRARGMGLVSNTLWGRYLEEERTRSRGYWWPSVADLELARQFLSCSRMADPSSQLIAVQSQYLESIGRLEVDLGSGAALGVDVIAVGEWSLLGALCAASAAGRLSPVCPFEVNENWLLRDRNDSGHVIEYYRRCQHDGVVEAIAPEAAGLGFDAISVSLVEVR